MTETLLKEFIERGGVITLYPSNDKDLPFRFSLKFEGATISGKDRTVEDILFSVLAAPDDRDHADDEALAAIVGYDGPFF